MPSLEANGVSLHYAALGDGPPLVLLGGTLSTADPDFLPQIDFFARDFRVIAPDRRGYGRSRPPARDYPDDFYQRDADDMAVLLQGLGVTRATLLGWSEGAAVALCLARSCPARVARLVVWGGICAVRPADLAVFEASRDFAAWPGGVARNLTRVYGEAYWQQAYGRWCDAMGRLCANGGDVKLGSLEDIACPTLIVHGVQDRMIARYHPLTLHGRIPGARLHEIEAGGHYVHLSRAEEFNRAVAAFLAAPAGS